MNSWIKASHR